MSRLYQLLLFFLLFLPAIPLNAQVEKADSTAVAQKRAMTKVKDGLVTGVRYTEDKLKEVGKQINAIDTNYISPNLYNLAFMLEHSTWYEHYQLGTNQNDHPQKLNFSPNLGTKMGIYFGWRWIFLGYTFDIEDLFGGNKNKPKKKEMSLNLYSSKFGVDLYYRKTGSDFKLRSQEGFYQDNQFKNIQFDGLQSSIMGLNAYWIFNHKKF